MHDINLTRAWTPLRYHEKQAQVWRSQARFVCLAAGRGSGKTELARRRSVYFLTVKKPWSDPRYFYALPTYRQAKRVAWDKLLSLIPDNWHKRQPNSTSMEILTVWGSRLFVVGMDKPQRIEGDQYDGCVIDESSDQKPRSFDLSVRPALSHRNAWAWRIGVPKRQGIGAREFKMTYESDQYESYQWPSSDILTHDEIMSARESMDPKDYREQYEASFEEVGGLIFYTFNEHLNVKEVPYQPELPIYVGADFNVDPMSWVVGHIVDAGKERHLHIFDELFVRNTNTRQCLDRLYTVYGQHQGGWVFEGDASAQSRHTSTSESDYIQIRNDTRFERARIRYPKSNPKRSDRFASCNALISSASETRRCFVHPRCKNLIHDLQTRGYKQGSNEPDDYGDVGHITDALGYIIHMEFPLAMRARRQDRRVEVTVM